MPSSPRRSALAALAAYVAVFAVLAWPWIRVATHANPGATEPADARLIAWILAWVAHALATGPAHLVNAPINHPLPGQLTGSMGEMLKVLIEDFRTGKKALNDLAVRPEDGCLRLKWPQAFAGYGFTPKQILDGLTERGWMEADSEVAKVGEAEFASGIAKAIRLTKPISNLFPQRATTTPQCAPANAVSSAEPQHETKTVRQSAVPEQQNIAKPRNKPRKRPAPKSGAAAVVKEQSPPPVDPPSQMARLNELLQAAKGDGKELTRRDINLLVQQKVGSLAAARLMQGIALSDIPELKT